MGIIGRITSDLKLMLQRPPRQQFAAICHRTKKKTGDLEVLLITSRDTGRWVIPKGWHMPGKQPHAIAEREAFEEAGIQADLVVGSSVGSLLGAFWADGASAGARH